MGEITEAEKKAISQLKLLSISLSRRKPIVFFAGLKLHEHNDISDN